MKRFIVFFIFCLLLLTFWLLRSKSSIAPVVNNRPHEIPTAPKAKLAGDELLENYASEKTTAKDDLTLMHQVLDNFLVIYKKDTPSLHGSNEEMAKFLRGENPQRFSFISASSKAFDKSGKLIDRYGTPLFFHHESGKEITIRSAGEDKVMFTEDDLYRKQNGELGAGK